MGLTLSKTVCHYSSMPNEVSATFHMALTQAPHIEGIKSYGSCAGRRCGGCWPAIDDSLPRQFMGREFSKRPVPEKSADMVFPHLPAHAQPNRSCPFSNCTPTMQIGKASTAAPVSSIFSLNNLLPLAVVAVSLLQPRPQILLTSAPPAERRRHILVSWQQAPAVRLLLAAQ